MADEKDNEQNRQVDSRNEVETRNDVETQNEEVPQNDAVTQNDAGSDMTFTEVKDELQSIGGFEDKPKRPSQFASILPWGLVAILAIALVIALVMLKPSGETEVVASVNGHELTEHDLYIMMKKMIGNANVANIAEQMIAEHLVHDEAKLRNIVASDEDYTNRVNKLKDQFPDEEQFEMALQQAGLTVDTLKEQMTLDILIDKIVGDKVTITDEMIAVEFEVEKRLYAEPEQIHAAHILVDTKESADDILKQIQEGAEFAELAKEHSTDGSAEFGGDLGYFPKGQMVLPFEQAAFALKKDELSAVVETPFGFHIIKAIDVPRDWTLEEKEEELRNNLYDKQIAIDGKQWIEEQRANGDIEIYLDDEA